MWGTCDAQGPIGHTASAGSARRHIFPLFAVQKYLHPLRPKHCDNLPEMRDNGGNDSSVNATQLGKHLDLPRQRIRQLVDERCPLSPSRLASGPAFSRGCGYDEFGLRSDEIAGRPQTSPSAVPGPSASADSATGKSSWSKRPFGSCSITCGKGGNWTKVIGTADDFEDADGTNVLSIWQATDKGLKMVRGTVAPRQGGQCSFGDDDDGVGAGLGAQRPSRFKIFCGPRNHKPLRAPPITDEIAAMSAALTPPPARHASRPPSACLKPRLPGPRICARVCARSSCRAVGSDAARPLDFGIPSSRLISSRRHRRRRQMSVVEQSCSSVDWRPIVSLHLVWRQPCPPASSA
jgi:hypothetical protein